jgi:multidrug resistance protein, MATE family
VLLHYPEPFFSITQTSPAVEAKCRAYLSAIAWGVPALMLFRVFSAFSTSVSRARPVMMLNLLGLAVKVPLSWALMFGKLGAPELGSTGCAVATAIAAWMTCIVAWVYCLRSADYARFGVSARWSRPNWRSIGHLLALGIPMGATFVVDVTAFTFMTLFVARLGTAVSGAHQIAANFSALLFMLPLALGNACGVLVGQSLGAREFARARHTGVVALLLSGGIALAASAAMILFRDRVAAMYALDPAVREIAAVLLAIVAGYHFVDALLVVVMNVLRGYKRTVVPMIATTLALWGVGLAGGYWLAFSPAPWSTLVAAIWPAFEPTLGPGLARSAPLGASGFWIAAVASVGLAMLSMLWYFAAVSGAAIRASRKSLPS